jgi:hypothetical protein
VTATRKTSPDISQDSMGILDAAKSLGHRCGGKPRLGFGEVVPKTGGKFVIRESTEISHVIPLELHPEHAGKRVRLQSG